MSDAAAIMFDFVDERSARLAGEMLEQLGYSYVAHDFNRIHIHMESSDLTSALEIAQAYGGTLVEQSPIERDQLVSSAYALDGIPIPAHLVNEDWIAEEEENRRLAEQAALLPEVSDSDYFSGDVHA